MFSLKKSKSLFFEKKVMKDKEVEFTKALHKCVHFLLPAKI